MPSTLTTAQKVALFSVLHVPYSTSRHSLTSGNLAAVEETVPQALAAKTLIEARLTELSAVAEVETELKTLLTSWIAVKDKVRRIDGGSVGGVAGVSSDPAEQRVRYEDQIINLVPFYEAHKTLGAAGGFGFVPRIF